MMAAPEWPARGTLVVRRAGSAAPAAGRAPSSPQSPRVRMVAPGDRIAPISNHECLDGYEFVCPPTIEIQAGNYTFTATYPLPRPARHSPAHQPGPGCALPEPSRVCRRFGVDALRSEDSKATDRSLTNAGYVALPAGGGAGAIPYICLQ